MIEDPEKEYKVKITFIKALIIGGLLMVIAPLFFLYDFEDEASAIAVVILGGILLIAGIIMGFIVSEINYPHEEEKADISWLVPILKPTKKRKQKNLPTKENVSCASASSS